MKINTKKEGTREIPRNGIPYIIIRGNVSRRKKRVIAIVRRKARME